MDRAIWHTAWILLGVAGVLIVGNAVFVAAETALVTVDRNLVESRAREGSVRFGRARGALQRLSTYLSGAQLGITVASLAIGLVAEPSLAALLRRHRSRRSGLMPMPQRWRLLLWRCFQPLRCGWLVR